MWRICQLMGVKELPGGGPQPGADGMLGLKGVRPDTLPDYLRLLDTAVKDHCLLFEFQQTADLSFL